MPKFKEKVITIADEIEQEGKEKGARAEKLETARSDPFQERCRVF